MKILIADDESIIRMGLKAVLNEMGHEVLTAVNGREALNMARTHRPDMAIFDIKMPYTDGLSAAKTLASTQPMPILLLTAFSEQDLIEKATDLPIQGYLVKPIKPEELRAAVAVARKRFADAQMLSRQAEQLAETLERRKLVDRAKGILMAQGMTEEAAYRALQKTARANRQSIGEAASAVIKHKKIPPHS